MSVSSTAAAVPSLGAKLAAEGFGTFLLVFGGVGTALFASKHFTDPGANSAVYVAIALAFGLALLVAFYAFAPLSGGHFNPAVTLGAAASGRIPWRDAAPYIVSQVVGGVIASTALNLIGMFGPDAWLTTAQDAGFASNGWGPLSPGGFGMLAAIIIEVILTGFFLLVFLGVTHPERGTPFAGIAIGLTLTLIHLVSLPVDFSSVNPARSIATAIYGGVEPLSQLWVFLVFPVVGAMLAGFAYKALFDSKPID
ncbi:Aquaporin Z [Microbacterium esteraromaticum]|uniref:Aquaporin Z n=1 Tax=Microbacterium esteraromaticum TaxID=57043 RepID=A0A1R4JFI3_9MICO|nr:aquaporin [Microbacterium esteraromaticum]SJN30778.1 Aquaporin Z [Microbacterium esteraromaticum]